MWLTALIIGLGGSLHCLGMCSPLVMSVSSCKPGALLNRLLYNGGRIAVYGMMGAFVSGVGLLLPSNYFQNVISMSLGLALLVIGLMGLRTIKIPGLNSVLLPLIITLKTLFATQLKQKSRGGLVLMGALNGLLPCGLTIVALSWCLTLKGPLDGLMFMLLFGVGTLPVMLGVTSALLLLVRKRNWNVQGLTTSMLIVSGFVLIARGIIVHIPHTHATHGGIVDLILCQ